MATFSSPMAVRTPFIHPAPQPAHQVPAGTFVSGTKVQVGNHRVIIERYLSEGGFAHVYVVRLPRPVDGNDLAVLKRVAVPDKEHLANMRTEVETMKRLRGHTHIVKYIDSHASQLKGSGYEVFLLMEYCSGGGLIDFMNTRLQQRLTEPEILNIFTDVAEGVACMHYLRPPLLHRDLKVENVLISVSGSSRTYKLCDFGSAAPPRPAATSLAEGRVIEDEIQRHTTLQYRSPEMIDVYRKQPIDEKSDIWALGVLLYKLCYYTTPFEEMGQMAILNASFKYPAYPRFSDQIKLLIASMLREQPQKRPNIYQILRQACQMQGRVVPIDDIYTGRTQSESRKSKQLPPSPPQPASSSSQSTTGATLSPPGPQTGGAGSIPDIAPMRRGRPTKPVSHHGSAKPSPSPLRMIDSSDPFASLDGGKPVQVDELSSRFPTLDQFSLLTDGGKKFEFDPNTEKKEMTEDLDLSKRVMNALADEAFARPPSPVKSAPQLDAASSATRAGNELAHKRSTEGKEARPQSQPTVPAPIPKKTNMISVGTMTSSSPPLSSLKTAPGRPVYRFPSTDAGVPRDTSHPRIPDKPQISPAQAGTGSRLANLLKEDALRSQPAAEEPRSPTSSRPSLEGGRPSVKDVDHSLHRSRSLNMKPRPVSVINIGGIGPPQIKDQDIRRSEFSSSFPSAEPDVPESNAVESDTNIASDVDFLKAKEEEEKKARKHHHKRLSGGPKHGKRASLSSISLSGTKNLLSGKFSDAFRRFEGNADATNPRSRSPSPSRDPLNVLTPIAGSETTDLSDDRHVFEETEDVSPEMRRELEKRGLDAEEKRVADAAAEYRRRLVIKGGGTTRDTGRAVSIQSKVHSLLRENEKPAAKTAAGYGRFTDTIATTQARDFEKANSSQAAVSLPLHQVSSEPTTTDTPAISTTLSTISLPSADPPPSRPLQRPTAPPKPKTLRTGQNNPPSQRAGSAAANGVGPESPAPAVADDWETNFNKRYPSLSGLEMVETEIDAPRVTPLRTREI